MLLRTTAATSTKLGRFLTVLDCRLLSTSSMYSFETLRVTSPAAHVLNVEMCRGDKGNAMNKTMWREFSECFTKIAQDANCRSVVLSGDGKLFTSGLDLFDHPELLNLDANASDKARTGMLAYQFVKQYQRSFSSIEQCPQPVIAAIHSACIGGGMDLIVACDMRVCSSDAKFCIKEVDVGLAADVGTLQRLPKIVGNDSLVRELAYTARMFGAQEALEMGLVSKVEIDRSAAIAAAVELASTIATKSPVAVAGTKKNLVYSRDHSVADGLEYVAAYNSSALQSPDVRAAALSFMRKRAATFPSTERPVGLVERALEQLQKWRGSR